MELAELQKTLSRLSLAELRLVLKLAEWLKEHAGELAD